MNNPKTAKENKKQFPLIPKLKLDFSALRAALKDFVYPSPNVIGIDAGYSYIKILQLHRSGKNYGIANFVTRAVPTAIKDDPVEKKRLIQGLLKEFITDSRIKSHSARIAVSGKGVFIFSFSLPSINKKDLRGMIGLEIKKRLPYQLEINNLVFDYYITGQAKDEKGQLMLQLTCIASDRAIIEEYLQMLSALKIRTLSIHAIPDALGNLVSYCVDVTAEKTVALLELGANGSSLNFYKGKSLVFSREIPLGGEHLSRAMAKPITSPAGTVEISVEEAEKLKRNWGIPTEEEAKTEFLTDFGMLLGEQVSTMLRPTLEKLILEIARTISYYSKTFKSENIEELYITGGTSRMKNIDKFLLYNLDRMKKVEQLNVLKTVKGWSETGVLKQELMMEQAAPHLAVAFGLCLKDGGRINLLPANEKIEQKARPLVMLLKIFFPALLAIMLVWYSYCFVNNIHYKGLIKKMGAQEQELNPITNRVKEFLDMKIKLDQRKQLLENARGKQPVWAGVFKELSNITPPEVILQKVAVATGNNAKEIRLAGKIVAKYTVIDLALSQYLMSLEDSPFFNNVELVSSEKDMYSPIPAANFEITCRLAY